MNLHGTWLEKPALTLREVCTKVLDRVVVEPKPPELAEQEKMIEGALREVYGNDTKFMWCRNRVGVSIVASFVDGMRGRAKYMARIQYHGQNHHHLLNVVALVYFRMKERVRVDLGITV
jgi:hypothetical protein